RELADECLHALIEAPNIVLDMRAQQRLHAVAGELRLQLANRASGISEKASERRAHAGLRPGAFEQDAVENLHLIKTVALRLKELSPLFDGRFHNRVVVFGEGYVGPVRLEEILVDVEAGAKRLQRRLQPLYCIFLFRSVETFVVHTGNAEHHSHIAGLGKKGGLVPEAVQVDVVVSAALSFHVLMALSRRNITPPPRGGRTVWPRHSAACSVPTSPGCGETPDRCLLPNARTQNHR